jgi:serine/threonine-protein kinase
MTAPVRDTAPTTDRVLDDLIEAFASRLQAGERLDIEAYAREHPPHADELRRILPAMLALADLGRSAPRPAEDVPAAGPAPEVAGTLGDFRILREVGRGGMGVVYEAEQISLGRRVALKVLPFAAALDAKHLQRFKNEAQAAAQLHHTNIVPVHFVGSERGVHFYAMQFIDGQTLAEVVRDMRRLAGRGAAGPGPGTPGPSPNPEEARVMAAPPFPREQGAGRGADAAPTQPAAVATERSAASPGFVRLAAQLGIQAAEALEHAHQLVLLCHSP